MFIVFYAGSRMGRKFEDNEEGNRSMMEFIKEILIKYPSSSVRIENFN